jgi:filamentous hemagglutinin
VTNFSRIAPGGGLTAHETAGGHTLVRHVSLTETELALRLDSQATLPRASSFTNREIAEQAISDAIDANQTQITNWIAGTNARFQINHAATNPIGMTLARGATSPVTAQNLQIVLKRDASLALGYYILTAYPEQ